MRTIPLNSGIAASEIPVIVIDLSVNCWRSPATTPPRIERDADQEGDECELEGVLERRCEEIPGRRLLRQRRSEVALEQIARPVHVLDEHRLVGPELLVQRVDGLLGGERPENGSADVAGKDRGDCEDHHGQQEQRDDRRPEPLEKEAGHASPDRATRRRRTVPCPSPAVLPGR